ncbi:MAG: hypothetical protein J1E38_02960 [Paramuribaculum sp.]|nr:hypothetical protein [Paramuribaculum sp.]
MIKNLHLKNSLLLIYSIGCFLAIWASFPILESITSSTGKVYGASVGIVLLLGYLGFTFLNRYLKCYITKRWIRTSIIIALIIGFVFILRFINSIPE